MGLASARNGHLGHWPKLLGAWERLPLWLVPLFAFAAPLSKAAGNILLGLIILYWLAEIPRFRRAAPKDPFLIGTLAFAAFLAFSVVWGTYHLPPVDSSAEGHLEVAIAMLRIPLAILAVSWVIYRGGIRHKTLWVLFVVGTVIAIAYPVLLGDIPFSAALGDPRTGLGISGTPNNLGLFAALALGLLGLIHPEFQTEPGQRLRTAALIILWFAAIGIALFGLLASQSRSAWVAAAVGIPLGLLAQGLRGSGYEPSTSRSRHWGLAGLAAFLLVLGVGLWGAWGSIEDRFARESVTLKRLASGEIEEITDRTSMGKRVAQWSVGLAQWWQRPLIGHGPAAPEHFMEASKNTTIQKHPNLHNIIIDILVRMGLIGILFLLGFFIYMIRLNRMKEESNGSDFLPFVITTLSTLLIHSLAHSSALTGNSPLFFLALLGGAVHSAKALGSGTEKTKTGRTT